MPRNQFSWFFSTIAVIAMMLFIQHPISAQDETEAWDVTLARGDTRDIDFETDEGTWMSLDISPDGQWVIFDLLAHVYRLPIAGGEAESLTQESGVALNYHPKFSPDGTRIAFVSDRAGQNNLWVMDADAGSSSATSSSGSDCHCSPGPPGACVLVTDDAHPTRITANSVAIHPPMSGGR